MEQVDFRVQNRIYQNLAIDTRDPDYKSLDTSFAISHGVLFSNLVELKKKGLDLPDYYKIEKDIVDVIDELHQDDSIKSVIRANFKKYVIKDPNVALMLERFRDHGKKLMIITNSDYAYTKAVMDFAVNPWLENHKSWQDIFDIIITLADKPKFFQRSGRFLSIDRETGMMSNYQGSVSTGLFQGGSSVKLQEDLELSGDEILYIGDHIYGDVVSIKKECGWRTALVLGDLKTEMEGIRRGRKIQDEIDRLMKEKTVLERQINRLSSARVEGRKKEKGKLDKLYRETDALNARISEDIVKFNKCFNPYWGEILRAGSEESLFAEQVERYACIYMTRVSDLYFHSPRIYFRPERRIMPHEAAVLRDK